MRAIVRAMRKDLGCGTIRAMSRALDQPTWLVAALPAPALAW